MPIKVVQGHIGVVKLESKNEEKLSLKYSWVDLSLYLKKESGRWACFRGSGVAVGGF